MPRLLLPLCLLFLALAGPAPAQTAPPVLRLVWFADLPPQITPASVYTFHNLRLLIATPTPDGPRLHRLLLRTNGADEQLDVLSHEGLPADFTPLAIEAHAPSNRLFLVGPRGANLVAYRADVAQDASISPWVELPPFPDAAEAVLVNTDTNGDHLLVFARHRAANGLLRLGGWITAAGAPAAQWEWRPLPAPEVPRTGHAMIATADRLVIAGGRAIDPATGQPGRPAALCEVAPLVGPEVQPWRQTPIPVSPRLGDLTATAAGIAFAFAPRVPAADAPTSMTVYLGGPIGEAMVTEFRPAELELPAQPIHALEFDPPHEWLLTISQPAPDAPLLLAAHAVPGWLPSRPRTQEEVERRLNRRLFIRQPSMTLSAATSEASRLDRLMLFVISSDDPDEEYRVLEHMNSNTFRYMSRGFVVSFLKGSAGREVLDKYGIRQTPAYLVINTEGALASQHTGSVPRPNELFQITEPSRLERPEPAPPLPGGRINP